MGTNLINKLLFYNVLGFADFQKGNFFVRGYNIKVISDVFWLI